MPKFFKNGALLLKLLRMGKDEGEIKTFEIKEDKVAISITLRTKRTFTGFDTTHGGKHLSAILDGSEWLTVVSKENGRVEIEVGDYEQHITVFRIGGRIQDFHVRSRTIGKEISEISFEEEETQAKLHLK